MNRWLRVLLWLVVSLALIFVAWLSVQYAGSEELEQPGPVESLIPALCIEREPDGTVHPCDDGGAR